MIVNANPLRMQKKDCRGIGFPCGCGQSRKAGEKGTDREFLDGLERQDGVVTEFDEDQWYSLIDFVTVFNKDDVRFTFKDSTEIKV